MSKAIGIDLGTTYSCIAHYSNGQVKIIENEQKFKLTPSVVAFTSSKRLIGDAAKSHGSQDPTNTVFDVKRLIGRMFSDREVQIDCKNFPFTVIDMMGKPVVKVKFKGEEKNFTPEEISSMILARMKETAERYLRVDVVDAVVTVPAYFNNSQRQSTIDAAKIAGMNVLRIINEPAAAAIAYGFDKKAVGEKKILIIDLGGGTFDVSLLTIKDKIFSVHATAGNSHLGGEDFDHRLVKYFSAKFKKKHNKDIFTDPISLRRLRSACERAKRILSYHESASIAIESLYQGIPFYATISRAKFDDICEDLFKSILDPVKQVLERSNINKSSVDEIVLVGGSTSIPKVRHILSKYFNGKNLNTTIDPGEAVAYGAAVQAAILSGDTSLKNQNFCLRDVTPMSLGIEADGGVMLTVIRRNSIVPIKKSRLFPISYNQPILYIRVFEGEHTKTKRNHLLGEFLLSDIPLASHGSTKVQVTFEIDANGILSISAAEHITGKSSKITITNDKGRLSKKDIDGMVSDAKTYKGENEKEAAWIASEKYVQNLFQTLRTAFDYGYKHGHNFSKKFC